MKYFSANPLGFYDSSVSAPPEGAVEIDDKTYANLLKEQSQGKEIVPDAQGFPIAREIKTPADVLVSRCKRIAGMLLAQSDWTQAVDVRACLLNVKEFDSYRRQLRKLRLNPVTDPVWPETPKTKWAKEN